MIKDLLSPKVDTGLRTNTVRGARVMVASRMVCQGVLTVGSVILARILEPSDFGLVAMATVLTGIIFEFGTLRLSDATVQRDSVSEGHIAALAWINLMLGTVVAACVVLSSGLIGQFYGEQRIQSILCGLSGIFVLAGLSTQHRALLQRGMRYASMARLDIWATVLSVVTAILAAVSGLGFWALVLRRVAYQFALTIGTLLLVQWVPRRPVFDKTVFSMLKFGGLGLGSYFLTYLTRNVEKFVIGWRLGAVDLGFYDRAYQIFVMPVYQVVTPLTTVAFSTLSRIKDDRERYGRYITKSLRLTTFCAIPLSVWVALTGEDVVSIVLGEKWAPAGPILRLLGPAIFMMLIHSMHQSIHLSLGHADRWLRWNAFRLVVTSLCLCVGLPFGLFGVAVSYVASIYLLAVPSLVYAGKPIGFNPFSSCGVELIKFFICGVVSGLLAWFTCYYPSLGFLPQAFNGLQIGRIILASIVLLLTYGCLNLLVFGSDYLRREIFALIREIGTFRAGASKA